MISRLGLLLSVTLSFSAAAADFSVEFPSLNVCECANVKQLAFFAVGDFTAPVEVHWSVQHPRTTTTSGTEVLTPEKRYGHINLDIADDEAWSNIVAGEATLTYVHPVSGQTITQSTPFSVTDEDFPTIQIDRMLVVERDEPYEIPIRIDRVPLVWVGNQVIQHLDESSATWHEDYDLQFDTPYVDPPIQFLPGQMVDSIWIAAYPDANDEKLEYVVASTEWGSRQKIYIADAGQQLTVSPDRITLMAGDAAVFEIELPYAAPWDIPVGTISSSTSAVVVPGAEVREGEEREAIGVEARAAGQTIVTIEFPGEFQFPAATVEIDVYGDHVELGRGERLRLGVGETAEVPVRVQPGPPDTAMLAIESAAPAIARVDRNVGIDSSGESVVFVTGVGPGTTEVTLYSPGGQPVATLAVDVVHEMTLASVTPRSGPAKGGTRVTFRGSGFVAPCTVTFGERAASNVTLMNATTLEATTPANRAGTVAAAVTCAGATRTVPFTYSSRVRAVRH